MLPLPISISKPKFNISEIIPIFILIVLSCIYTGIPLAISYHRNSCCAKSRVEIPYDEISHSNRSNRDLVLLIRRYIVAN